MVHVLLPAEGAFHLEHKCKLCDIFKLICNSKTGETMINKYMNAAFALLFGLSASCRPENLMHGNIEFDGYVNNGQDRVYYNEGVGMPRANRMIAPLDGRVFTLYDVNDRIPVADPMDAQLERICVGDGSRSLPCYRTDGTTYYRVSSPLDEELTGQEETDARALFAAGNARYNANRPEIAKQLAARHANMIDALKP